MVRNSWTWLIYSPYRSGFGRTVKPVTSCRQTHRWKQCRLRRRHAKHSRTLGALRKRFKSTLGILARACPTWGEGSCIEEVAAFDECALRGRNRRHGLTLDVKFGVSVCLFEARWLFLHAFFRRGMRVGAWKIWRSLMNSLRRRYRRRGLTVNVEPRVSAYLWQQGISFSATTSFFFFFFHSVLLPSSAFRGCGQ